MRYLYYLFSDPLHHHPSILVFSFQLLLSLFLNFLYLVILKMKNLEVCLNALFFLLSLLLVLAFLQGRISEHITAHMLRSQALIIIKKLGPFYFLN
jgi:hypothetical protein